MVRLVGDQLLPVGLHHHRRRHPHAAVAAAAVHRRVLLPVLRLPRVVDLQSPVKLFPAGLQELDVARRVDGVAKLGVLPLGQVVLVRARALDFSRLARGCGSHELGNLDVFDGHVVLDGQAEREFVVASLLEEMSRSET